MQRYSQQAFPPYQYTPGQNPHPIIHPDGHSHNAPETSYTFDPDKWQDSQRFLFGIDLLNHEYFWEAHEALEDVWHCVARDSEAGKYLQALIMLAVSQLHRRRQLPDTAAKVAGQGLEKLAGLKRDRYGTQLEQLREKFQCIVAHQTITVQLVLEGI